MLVADLNMLETRQSKIQLTVGDLTVVTMALQNILEKFVRIFSQLVSTRHSGRMVALKQASWAGKSNKSW